MSDSLPPIYESATTPKAKSLPVIKRLPLWGLTLTREVPPAVFTPVKLEFEFKNPQELADFKALVADNLFAATRTDHRRGLNPQEHRLRALLERVKSLLDVYAAN